jgi:hypothetical protein
MVGVSVGHVRNSARSLAWTAGWQQSANSVQETAVLEKKRVDCMSKCEPWGIVGPTHLVVSCPAIKNVGISRMHMITREFEQRTEHGQGKRRARDKISESLIRMVSGISEAIFDLMSKLRRS